MEFDYNKKDFLESVGKTIDRNESFRISVSGFRRNILKKSMPMYIEYFIEKESRIEKAKKSEILKFAVYGIFTPVIWSVINQAVLKGMTIEYSEMDDRMLIHVKAGNGK